VEGRPGTRLERAGTVSRLGFFLFRGRRTQGKGRTKGEAIETRHRSSRKKGKSGRLKLVDVSERVKKGAEGHLRGSGFYNQNKKKKKMLPRAIYVR